MGSRRRATEATKVTAFDPKGRGAGDIAFVSPPLTGLDGLGLGGNGEHSVYESADLRRAGRGTMTGDSREPQLLVPGFGVRSAGLTRLTTGR